MNFEFREAQDIIQDHFKARMSLKSDKLRISNVNMFWPNGKTKI